MSPDEPKKKRRQNVACDSCKLRRIKCDLLNLLSELPSTSTSTSASASASGEEETPLNVLVQRNPDVGCTNCKNKGLKCTTEGIVNPTRPNKGGKRIDEARRVFGEESRGSSSEVIAADEVPLVGLSGSGQSGSADQVANPEIDMTWVGFNIDPISVHPNQLPPHMPQEQQDIDYLLQDLLNMPSNPIPSTSTINAFPDSNPSFNDLSTGYTTFADLQFPYDAFLDDASLALPTPAPASLWNQPNLPSQYSFDIQHPKAAPPPTGNAITQPSGTYSTTQGIWDDLNANRQGMIHHALNSDPAVSRGSSAAEEGWALAANQGLSTNILDVFKPGTRRSRVAAPTAAPGLSEQTAVDPSPLVQISRTTSALDRFAAPRASPTPPTPSSNPQEARSLPGRKRLRTPSETYSDSDGGGKMIVLSDNPWRIWAPSDISGQVARWTRREAVQEQLADRSLGQALSRHLVQTFFQAVYLSYPAISADSFYTAWTKAGQRSDRMTAAQEVLCAVIEAWGARYSDSPAVLGLSPQKAQAAPKVIKADGTFMPGTQARAHWGRARLNVCNALKARARRLMDESGILREPTITGLQALTLYTQMLHMTDEPGLANDYWMQTRMLHSTMMEQMELLGLTWTSTGSIVVHEEDKDTSLPQLRLKQRRLFWTHMVGDAFFAAASAQLPKISQEDVDAAGLWLHTVDERLPHSTFKAVAFFISCYHRLGVAARDVATKISYPGRRKGTINPDEFCKTVRKLWSEIDAISREIDEKSPSVLQDVERSDPIEFSPVNYIVNLRLSAPLLLLIIHQNIHEQLEFRKTLSSAYISSAAEESMTSTFATTSVSGSTSTSPSSTGTSSIGASERRSRGDAGAAQLDQLNKQSVDHLLKTCRAQVVMVKALIPTGMIQTASVFIRDLNAMTQFLAEIPTNEQGYPSDTPGGYGWTWDAKQREMQVFTDSLYQVGWAWSDAADILDNVMVTMERMTPSPEVLEKWRNTHQTVNEAVSKRNEKDSQQDQVLIDTALSFWPPIAVPSARLALTTMDAPLDTHTQTTEFNMESAFSDTSGAIFDPANRDVSQQHAPHYLRHLSDQPGAVNPAGFANIATPQSVYPAPDPSQQALINTVCSTIANIQPDNKTNDDGNPWPWEVEPSPWQTGAISGEMDLLQAVAAVSAANRDTITDTWQFKPAITELNDHTSGPGGNFQAALEIWQNEAHMPNHRKQKRDGSHPDSSMAIPQQEGKGLDGSPEHAQNVGAGTYEEIERLISGFGT